MPAGCVALVARCSCCALLASVLVDVAALKQPDVRSVDRSNISSHALLSRALLRSEKTQGGFASTEDACEKCYLDYPAAACYVGICQGDTGEKGKPYCWERDWQPLNFTVCDVNPNNVSNGSVASTTAAAR
eukprot:TRINITY_DN37473_c0_g1_i2.p2 TRINITY_DN37473_c0_g1~~TRINITY_DN37473_c0_g1_i2.p2  ORF type:complete len:131 (-),score=18.25 TRINITY_DN37473_c0_g1_i2:164-556(-)